MGRYVMVEIDVSEHGDVNWLPTVIIYSVLEPVLEYAFFILAN